MEKIFKGLGSVTGRFYNSHQEWQKAPDWVKEHYKIEEQQHCGDITTIPSGALQGALNAVVEFAKQNRTDAAQMGKKIAESAGIQPEYGLAFASGFYDTARFGNGATKSIVEASEEYFKKHPPTAKEMNKYLVKTEEEQGLAFASGFLGTAQQ